MEPWDRQADGFSRDRKEGGYGGKGREDGAWGARHGARSMGHGAWGMGHAVGSSELGWGLRFEIADWQSGLG